MNRTIYAGPDAELQQQYLAIADHAPTGFDHRAAIGGIWQAQVALEVALQRLETGGVSMAHHSLVRALEYVTAAAQVCED